MQLTKVLLHMEDRYNTAGFWGLRQAAMVALVVTDCVPVRGLTSDCVPVRGLTSDCAVFV